MTHFRTCPACQTRYGGHIDPACALCLGEGVLALGSKWCDDDDPEIVARAVGMTVAWIVVQKDGPDRAENLRQQRRVLARSGLIDVEIDVDDTHPSLAAIPSLTTAARRRKSRKAADLARAATGTAATIHSIDAYRDTPTKEQT